MTTQDWIDKFSAMGVSTLADITPKEARELAAHLRELKVKADLVDGMKEWASKVEVEKTPWPVTQDIPF